MGGFHFLKTNILQLARKNSGVVRDLVEVLETLLKIPKSVLDYKDSPMTNYIPVIVQTWPTENIQHSTLFSNSYFQAINECAHTQKGGGVGWGSGGGVGANTYEDFKKTK